MALFEDEFVVLSPAADGVVAGPMPLRRLAGAPLIGQHACTCQAVIDHELLLNGVEPKYVFRSNDNSAVQAMVRAGMGHAVMPQLAIDISDPGVVVRRSSPRWPAAPSGSHYRSGERVPPPPDGSSSWPTRSAPISLPRPLSAREGATPSVVAARHGGAARGRWVWITGRRPRC